MPARPLRLTLRAYQVGFGDCFLLTFHYPKGDRHILIDFGSTGFPRGTGEGRLADIAKDIARVSGGKLQAVVASHRHRDHISGFAIGKANSPGGIIAACKPEIVIQSWTEDPKAKPNARGSRAMDKDSKAFVRSMLDMQLVARSVLKEIARRPAGLGASAVRELKFLGDSLENRAAVEGLMSMGKGMYVHYGSKSGLDRLLPGVKTYVLGPPTLTQSDKIQKQRSKDEAEFWHLQAARFWHLQAAISGQRARRARKLFPSVETYEGSFPPETRWLRRRLQSMRGDQLLEIVRALDKVLNNTSVILLFEIGKTFLLFPGDAQIENWLYVLETAPDRARILAKLRKTNLYKVGHHGSLNATPKTLWNMFGNRNTKESGSRLRAVMSTMKGKHGKASRGTEVPRSKLVAALKSETSFFTTESIRKPSLSETLVIPV